MTLPLKLRLKLNRKAEPVDRQNILVKQVHSHQ